LEVNGLVVGGGWQAKPLGGGGSGRESPPSLESRAGGWRLAGKTSHSHFKRGRWWWWAQIPSVIQIASGRMAVGRQNLPLTFRARDVVVVGVNPLRHSNREWEDGGWQAKPPTRVSSEGGGGGGRESPPSLKSRVGGWWLAGKTSHSRFERGRWCWWVCRLALVGAYASTYQCWGWAVAAHPHPRRCSLSSSCPSRRDGHRSCSRRGCG